MGHEARVLRELTGAQAPHGFNAGDGNIMHIGAEFLFTKDRQTLLQGQLEPVAACDTIASPVILVE